jgi:hypothetical protein
MHNTAAMALRLALAAAALVGTFGGVPAAQAAPISSHAMVYSCCTPPELAERIFAEAAATGSEYVRVDVQMTDVFEKEGGRPAAEPDWSGLDRITELARRHRLKVLGILLNPPSWLTSCPTRFPHHVRCPAEDATEFGRLAGEIAAHAGAAVDHWEILNEPDGDWAFEGSPEEYAHMLVAARTGIAARAPADRIVLGGMMSPQEPEWLERVLAVPGAAQSFDIANVHLRGSVAGVVNRYLEVRARLAQHGFAGPLWVTEHGYAAEPAFQSDPFYRGGDDAQARYLTQSLVGLGEAGAEQIFVTLRDQGTGAYATEGLARISETPGYEVQRRPAFAAVQRVALNWEQLLAWRADQRRQEQLQRISATAALFWRDQAMTGRQRLRQARVRGAPRLVARYRRELGWQRAVLGDYRLRTALFAAAAAELRARIAGP